MGKMQIWILPAIRCLLCLYIWLSAASGLSQDSPLLFTSAECPGSWRRPGEWADNFTCSRLYVKEDRQATDDAQTLGLFVVRISARLPSTNAPLVVLTGGPGDSASAEIDRWLSTQLRDGYDIILIDQRGTGFSHPSLNCPEFDRSDDEFRLKKCRERLLAAGIGLSAYSAESIAQDIADLIVAMEVDQVNIYARSYGARLALLLARKLPQRVRAMALDSAYTGGESALEGAAANTRRSLQRLFADCRASDACHATYPALSAQFSRAAAALASRPMAIAGMLPGAAFQLDAESFVLLLRDMLADANRLPYIPALIDAVAEGDYDVLVDMATEVFAPAATGPDSHSEGLYFSAFCADETALTSSAKIKAGAAALPPAFQPLAESALGLLADCQIWIDAGDRANGEPPRLEIPTLNLAGAYDPIAPGALSDSPLSWHRAFPHLGHGVLAYEPCAVALVAAFLVSPAETPLDGCLQELRPPRFYIRHNE